MNKKQLINEINKTKGRIQDIVLDSDDSDFETDSEDDSEYHESDSE